MAALAICVDWVGGVVELFDQRGGLLDGVEDVGLADGRVGGVVDFAVCVVEEGQFEESRGTGAVESDVVLPVESGGRGKGVEIVAVAFGALKND